MCRLRYIGRDLYMSMDQRVIYTKDKTPPSGAVAMPTVITASPPPGTPCLLRCAHKTFEEQGFDPPGSCLLGPCGPGVFPAGIPPVPLRARARHSVASLKTKVKGVLATLRKQNRKICKGLKAKNLKVKINCSACFAAQIKPYKNERQRLKNLSPCFAADTKPYRSKGKGKEPKSFWRLSLTSASP